MEDLPCCCALPRSLVSEVPLLIDPLNSIQRASSDQFTKQSHRYARGHILEDVADLEAALELIHLPHVAKVLDVATGVGHAGLYLAQLGHQVVCSDLTGAMLDRAREAAAARGIAAEFRQHPAEQLPYPDETFDLVTCRVAPHHFSDPGSFVSEAARVLKANGSLLVIDGTVPDGHAEAEAWMHEVEKLRDPSHHRLLTPGTWTELCEGNHLTVVACDVSPRQQPDLEWYFETANTSPENRARVRTLVETAPASARRLFSIEEDDGKTVWWWPMLTLVARNPNRSRPGEHVR